MTKGKNVIIFNKRANIVAAILMVVVILAAGLLYAQQNVFEKQNPDEQSRVTTEAELTMQQAISFSISDLMLNGFSNITDVWYCNYPIPPELNTEVKPSLDSFASGRVESLMQNLRDKNSDYSISSPSVTFEVANNIGTLDLDKIEAAIAGFEAGISTENLVQSENLSKSLVNDYRTWLMYKNLYQWMDNNAGQLTQNIWAIALQDTQCQAIVSGCLCADATFSPSIIDSLKLRPEQVTPAIDVSISSLNAMFSGTPISCSYNIEKLRIENTEKIDWAASTFGPSDGQTIPIDYSENYNYSLKDWVDSYTLADSTKPNGGCPALESLPIIGAANRPDLSVVNDITQAYTEQLQEETCTEMLDELGENVETESMFMKIGMLAIDKKLGILMSVKCSDQSVSVETSKGFEPLSVQVKMRVSVVQDCPLPNNTADRIPPDGEPLFCPGGESSAPAVHCPVACPECFGCAFSGGDPDDPANYACTVPTTGARCSTECSLCNAQGQCVADSATNGDSCGEGECNACVGGACQFNPPIAAERACSAQACAVCSGDPSSTSYDGCNDPPPGIQSCNDPLIPEVDRTCLKCSNAQAGTCDTNLAKVGQRCTFCSACSAAGTCSAPMVSAGQEVQACQSVTGLKCVSCSLTQGGVCALNTALNSQCGACQTCAADGSCTADDERGGCSFCMTCSNGKCVPDSAKTETSCKTSNDGCDWQCSAAGKCAVVNVGTACTRSGNTCGLFQQCTAGGCETQSLGEKCCGSKLCNSGDPCCFVGGDSCEVCPPTT